jgi:hypothetical protein
MASCRRHGSGAPRVAALVALAASAAACSFAWDDYEPLGATGQGGGAAAGGVGEGGASTGPASTASAGGSTTTTSSGAAGSPAGSGGSGAGGDGGAPSTGGGGSGGMAGTGECGSPIVAADPSMHSLDTGNYQDGADGSCFPTGGAPDVVFSVDVQTTGVLQLDMDSRADLVMYVRTVCNDEGTEIGCVDEAGGGDPEQLKVLVSQGETVYVFVDGYDGDDGPFTLDIGSHPLVCGDSIVDPGEDCDPPDGVSCSSMCQALPEVCTDGADNDLDDLTDCEDTGDCGGNAACPIAATCAAAIPLASSQMGNTGNGTDDFAGSCVGSPLTGEVLYAYGATQAGALLLTLDSAADLGLYARDACNNPGSEVICLDNAGTSSIEQIAIPVGAGDSLTIFVDGYQGDEGAYALTSSFATLSESEPNGTSAQADGFGSPFVGTIYPAGDEDFVAVTVPAGSTIIAEVLGLVAPSCGDNMIESELQIYDTDGTTTLDYDDDGGEGDCSLATASGLSAGTYFIRVASPQPSSPYGVFGYQLDVTIQ